MVSIILPVYTGKVKSQLHKCLSEVGTTTQSADNYIKDTDDWEEFDLRTKVDIP